jgi:hypothetical protein
MHRAQTASVFPSILSGGEQLLNRDPGVSLPKSADVRYRFVDFFLSPIHLGHDSGNGAAMSGNDQRFAPLHVIQQLRQMGFGFGSLNFTRGLNFDWSI